MVLLLVLIFYFPKVFSVPPCWVLAEFDMSLHHHSRQFSPRLRPFLPVGFAFAVAFAFQFPPLTLFLCVSILSLVFSVVLVFNFLFSGANFHRFFLVSLFNSRSFVLIRGQKKFLSASICENLSRRAVDLRLTFSWFSPCLCGGFLFEEVL